MSDVDDFIEELGRRFTTAIEQIAAALAPAFAQLVEAVQNVVARFAQPEDLVRRYAIEQLDIPESDIRDVFGPLVRLWNHRIVDVGLMTDAGR